MKQVLPYNESNATKNEQVGAMFDAISPKYDFLNRTLSMGIDRIWRNKVVRIASALHPQFILDVATGTGDLAIALSKTSPRLITGIDISEGMMEVGRRKVEKEGLSATITLEKENAEAMSFQSESFDLVTAAFGVRNFQDLEKGLKEINRVLKPGGNVIILEFSMPEKFPFRQIYKFYFNSVLPFVGRMVSKDARAYSYLPESVQEFPYGDNFVKILQRAGFKKSKCRPLTFGIASIYTGEK